MAKQTAGVPELQTTVVLAYWQWVFVFRLAQLCISFNVTPSGPSFNPKFQLLAPTPPLQANLSGSPLPPPIGNLIFSCNGRGRALFGEPNYDSSTVASFIPVPASGFQCNGEIGQVSGRTWLHGFTCSVGVVRAGRRKGGEKVEGEEELQKPDEETSEN